MTIHFTLLPFLIDGECPRCGEYFTYKAVALSDDGTEVCATCADKLLPGASQIVKGLDLIQEAMLFDVFTRPAAGRQTLPISKVLRAMADRIDDVMLDKVKLQICVEVVDGIWPHETGQHIGVGIDWRIDDNQPS
ncbi:hypothetical protein [Nonomuraea sp. NPDC049480]|uniref:hypothetical protein n=1 Tax=Nonomuraea sp. NPDC049480 TaxID=3364353 RepID=UPI0037A14CD4